MVPSSQTPQLPKARLYARYATAYVAWIASFLLWLWFMILGRNAMNGLLNTYYVPGNISRGYDVQLADRVYWFATGIAWLILMIVVEEYFRRGVRRGDLWRRIGRVFAPIVLLVFAADFAIAFLLGFENLPWLRWLLMIFELLAGIGLIWLARNGPAPVKSSHIARQ